MPFRDEIANLAPRSPSQSDLHRGHGGQGVSALGGEQHPGYPHVCGFEHVICTGVLSPRITNEPISTQETPSTTRAGTSITLPYPRQRSCRNDRTCRNGGLRP